jgi:hypothetical protein
MPSSLLIAFLAAPALVSAGPSSITPADIERVTGLKGIHLVSATAPGSVPGRDNYADATGKVVLWFQSFNAVGFARAKSQPARTMSGIEVEPKLYHRPVPGLGDEAFDSPDGATQHALYVRKGDAAFGVISNVDASGKPRIAMDHLKAIAALVLSRM